MLDNYPGAKTNSGIIPFMVNNIPYHERYVEGFAGSAQLFDKKKPAPRDNILIEINPSVADALEHRYKGRALVVNGPFLSMVPGMQLTRKDFVSLDPPYPEISRRSGKTYYKHELLTIDDHTKLLFAIRAMDANIMINTRQNELYDRVLKDWRKLEFDTVDRVGPVKEVIYMNYPPPILLHQYDMLGDDYIERQHIKRINKRLADKLNRIPPHQVHLMMQALINHDAAAVQHFLTVSAGK